MARLNRHRGRWRLFITAMLSLTILPALSQRAFPDCVAPLATCAMECDQATKVEDPDRPRCAQTCISGYQRCLRIEQIQSTTSRPVLNQRNRNAPAQ
jgi:hypothetical protein